MVVAVVVEEPQMAQKAQANSTAVHLVEVANAADSVVQTVAEAGSLVRMAGPEVDIPAVVGLAGCMEVGEGVAEDTSAAVTVVRGLDTVAGIEAVSCLTPEALRSLVGL